MEKQRRRYVVFEVLGAKPAPQELWEALAKVARGLEFHPLVYDPKHGLGMVRCGHKEVEELKRALTVLKEVGGGKVELRVKGVSGTIRRAKKKFWAKG